MSNDWLESMKKKLNLARWLRHAMETSGSRKNSFEQRVSITISFVLTKATGTRLCRKGRYFFPLPVFSLCKLMAAPFNKESVENELHKNTLRLWYTDYAILLSSIVLESAQPRIQPQPVLAKESCHWCTKYSRCQPVPGYVLQPVSAIVSY